MSPPMYALFADATTAEVSSWIAVAIAALATVKGMWSELMTRLGKRDELTNAANITALTTKVDECEADRKVLRDEGKTLRKDLDALRAAVAGPATT